MYTDLTVETGGVYVHHIHQREIGCYVLMWVQTCPSWLWSIFFGEGGAMEMERHQLQPPELDLALLLCLPTSCRAQALQDSCIVSETQPMCGGLEWKGSSLLLCRNTRHCRSRKCFFVIQSRLSGFPLFSCQCSKN